jgi:hypothetical protein
MGATVETASVAGIAGTAMGAGLLAAAKQNVAAAIVRVASATVRSGAAMASVVRIVRRSRKVKHRAPIRGRVASRSRTSVRRNPLRHAQKARPHPRHQLPARPQSQGLRAPMARSVHVAAAVAVAAVAVHVAKVDSLRQVKVATTTHSRTTSASSTVRVPQTRVAASVSNRARNITMMRRLQHRLRHHHLRRITVLQ